MRRLAWLFAAVLTLGAVAPRGAAAQDVGLAVGSRPTPIQVQDLDGKAVNLAQYIGKKPVVLIGTKAPVDAATVRFYPSEDYMGRLKRCVAG